jgi:hypothetical protein
MPDVIYAWEGMNPDGGYWDAMKGLEDSTKYHADHVVQGLSQIIDSQKQTHDALIKMNQELIEALGDIAYCKTWTLNNRPMDIVSIALKALKKARGE